MKKKILLSTLILIVVAILVVSSIIIFRKNEKRKKENGPTIIAQDETIYVGVKFDANKYAKVDDGVKLEVIRNDVNDHKAGEYTVTYKATDSYNNSSTKTIIVTVDELNQEKLKQEIESIISKLNLSRYNFKSNIGGGWNISSDKYLNNQINENQTMKMYNTIHISESFDEFFSDYELSQNCHIYEITAITFLFELTDRNKIQSDRYNLYSVNQSMQISNGDKTITIQNSAIDGFTNIDSKFEREYYISEFTYNFKITEISTLKEILSSPNVKLTVNAENMNNLLETEKVPCTFEFELNEEDTNNLKATVELYEEIVKIIGEKDSEL